MNVIKCSIVAVWLAPQALASVAANQEVLFRGSVGASILVDSPAYSRAPANENLVFPGTPLVLLLHVGNATTPRVADAPAAVVVEKDWPDLVRIRLLRGTVWEARTPVTEATCQPLHAISVEHSLVFDQRYFRLRDGAHFSAKCLLDPAIVDSLPAGNYVIEVDWNPERVSKNELRRHPFNFFPNLPGFSMREVKNEMDALDVQLRHATFALRQERFAEAIEFASRVLLTEPSSVRALATRALANVGLGRCVEAASDYGRAATSVEFVADVNAWPSGQDRVKQAEAMRRAAAGCRQR